MGISDWSADVCSSDLEVAQAIQRLKDAAVFARDSIDAPSRIVGSALAIGRKIEDVESWPERIGEVTVDYVNKAARSLLTGTGGVRTEEHRVGKRCVRTCTSSWSPTH